jgi:dTMP kinase
MNHKNDQVFENDFDYNAKLFFDLERLDSFENNQKTKIIVFEGIDGAGKTTQIKILKKFFDYKGYSYHQTREPGGSPIAEKIRNLFLEEQNFCIDSQILLCSAARKEHLNYIENLQKTEKFDFIIFDRFIDSTMAYQIIPNKLNPEIIHSLNRKFKINIKVDIAILLDIDPKYSLERRRKIENHFDSNLEYLKNVRKAYLRIWKNHIDGKNNFDKRIKIESGKNPKIVFKKILDKLSEFKII